MTSSKARTGLFDQKMMFKLATLCLGGGNIYMLVYMRGMFYDQIVEGMGLTNTQFGDMMGLYGLTTMVLYLVGGIVADKLSARKVLVASYILTGVCGFIYSTLPSYEVGMGLHFVWGVAHTLIFWASYIKLTRSLGDSEVQGRLFGFLEGGRALSITMVSAIAGLLFSVFDSPEAGLQAVILTYSVTNIIAAVLTWFQFEDTAPTKDNRDLIKNLGVVVRMPQAWIIGFMVMAIMATNGGQHYTTPYMKNILGISGGLVIMLGFMRSYAIKPIFAPLLGIITDKVNSPSRVLSWAFGLLCIVWVGILTIGAGNHTVFIALLVFLGISVAALRGVYFATIEECKVPMEYTGAFIGFICTIGMAPDAFLSPLIGRILDANPGAKGFEMAFMIILGFSVLGLVMSTALRMYNGKKVKQLEAAEASA
ncbi:MFS transporter [Pelagibaculum spongiae]|uniref:Major facilitator superfamily (MFS) profile domain-containing protein n=1 Tax=Pelagibaculum spongiae TaxID=2080658 RepID=A0A2V1H0B8_9GAMM|nr:MFS transporter [Pelagibaculum spongiae]PVZ70644.1 hypothetical protein DC094_08690 [Pelagibaculum spongiae]